MFIPGKNKKKAKPPKPAKPAAKGSIMKSLIATIKKLKSPQSLVSTGKKLKERIESHPKYQKLLEKIKNHPRVLWAVDKFQNLDWSERIIVLIGTAGLLLFILGPYSLLYRKTNLISYEAVKRGEALVHLLAASNQAAFTSHESVLYSVDSVARELGVNDAVVTDLDGVILSPLERFGQTLDKVKKDISTNGLTTHRDGLNYEFFYPIFKWVEKDQGFVKEPVGMAYLDYSAHESLDMMGSRAFHVFYLLVIFATVLGVVGYLIVEITNKPLQDLRYNILAFHRGGTDTLPLPEHFKALRDLTEEMVSALKVRGSDNPSPSALGTDESSLIEMVRQTALASQKEALLIDADKKLIFASDRIQEETKVEIDQHILRAVKSSPYVNELIDFFSKLFEESSKGILTLPGVGEMRGMVLKLWGKDYYLVMSL